MTFALEKAFDLPLFWSVDYVEKHLRQEVDFINEGHNGERCLRHIKEIPSLSQSIHVPKVMWDYTTQRILTCEWIDGIPFHETEKIKAAKYDEKDILTRIVNVFSDQIFRVGFVHW